MWCSFFAHNVYNHAQHAAVCRRVIAGQTAAYCTGYAGSDTLGHGPVNSVDIVPHL